VKLWRSVVGKLWMTIIGLVALVLAIVGMFLLEYIDVTFANSNDVKHLFIITGVIGFSLTTFFAFFLSSELTKPLVQLKEASGRISAGDYQTRIKRHDRRTDEIGELARAFNHMAEQLQANVMALSHEKEHLNSVLRSMNDAVITFNAEGMVILANPRGYRLIRDELPGDGVLLDGKDESIREPVRAPEPLLQLFGQVVADPRELHARLEMKGRMYSVILTPLYTEELLRGVVAVLRDVTEEHKLEKMRTDFIANVSHELRTPLSMLQGYSEALMDDISSDPEVRRELVQVIYDESLRMGRLVNQLLDLMKMDSGHFEIHVAPLNMRHLCERVARKFQTMAKEEGVGLKLAIDPDLPVVMGDSDRLEQVLTNLLDNAMRYTPKGRTITIRGFVAPHAGEASVVMEVADQGTGIPPGELPYVFERFYKVDKARTRGKKESTGLGLAIVKNIVEAHGGKVAARNNEDGGATFSFTIPLNMGQ